MTDARVIRKSIKQWPEKLATVNAEFLPGAAAIIQSAAMRNAAVWGNRLRGSIKTKVEKDHAKVYTNLIYAIYAEYGTGIYAEGGEGRKTPWVYFNENAGHFVTTEGMRAQPYMRPAVDSGKKKVRDFWRQIFRGVYGR